MNRQDYYNQRKNYQMGGMRKEYIMSLIPDGIDTVLEIGCGNGELAEDMRARGYSVTGTDISDSAIKEARKFLDDSFCFDIERENWPEELMSKKFDLIIASEIIEHLFDPDTFLKKMQLLLTSKGKVIITTPNVLFWKNRMKMLFGKFEYESSGIMDFGHVKFFTARTIRSAFKRTGFSIIREKNFYPNLYKRGFNFVGDILPGLFAYQLIFLLSND